MSRGSHPPRFSCHFSYELEPEPLPHFAGTQGPEIARSLETIAKTFTDHVLELESVRDVILDVKSTVWTEAYAKFQMVLKELEVMVQNVINSAFESVSDIDSGVTLLGFFDRLSARDLIRRTLDKWSQKLFALFARQLDVIKGVFNEQRKAPPLGPHMPAAAGAAFWARGLKQEITRSYEILEAAFFLTRSEKAEETMAVFEELSRALTAFTDRLYLSWRAGVSIDFYQLLSKPLMRRTADKAFLEMNFDVVLLSLFAEVHWWEKMGFDIPREALEVQRLAPEVLRLCLFQLLTGPCCVLRDSTPFWFALLLYLASPPSFISFTTGLFKAR